MKAITLTTPQQTQAATNKAAIASARAVLQAATQAQTTFLQTASNCPNQRVQLSDDGTMVIVG